MASICIATGGTARAAITKMVAHLDGAQEPTTSAGKGEGTFVLDTGAHTLSFNITFSGLTGTEIFAHIHGYAGRGAGAGIVFTLPGGSPKIGTWTGLSGTDEANVLAGLSYANIHTTFAGGGEIRGQIVPAAFPRSVPTAPATALIVFALLLLTTGAFVIRRRRVMVAGSRA